MASRRDTRHVRIADAPVMGQAAVLQLATVLAVVAVVQLFEGWGSALLPQFGGPVLDVAWSASLLLAAALVWAARAAHGREIAGTLEMTGNALISLAIAVYLLALRDAFGFAGSGLIVGLGIATIINLTGRSRLLWRRQRELRKAIDR